MGYSELMEAVRIRRSRFFFDPERPVTEAQVRAIMEIARWAPSAGNGQPWEVIAVTDPDKRRAIYDLYVQQRKHLDEMEEKIWGPRPGGGAAESGKLKDAPLILLITGDPRIDRCYPVRTRLEKSESHLITGLAHFTLLIHLAAASMGLGSHWLSDCSSPYYSVMLKSLLGIPEHLHIYEMAPIGYPIKEPTVKLRREVEEFLHWEGYDQGKARGEDELNEFLWQQTRLGSRKKPTSNPERV
ncbi:MAG: nitroreductase family protein [Firmicutes bacterium]|nr:nitroreductase family protein [Bacillota bacterium]